MVVVSITLKGPNDEAEVIRLDKSNVFYKHFCKGNFNSPIEERLLNQSLTVLDIGCGTGGWILDMAKNYPNSKFIGIDMSPVFPKENLPENVEFLECNVLDGLPFEDDTFDLVHERLVGMALTNSQWKIVIENELRLIKLDGWIEIEDIYPIIETTKHFLLTHFFSLSILALSKKLFLHLVRKFLNSRGLSTSAPDDLKMLWSETGKFPNIQCDKILIPLGDRAGIWGKLALEFSTFGLRATSPFIAPLLNITVEHYDALVETMEIEANKCNTHYYLHRIYGQRKL
ncbi:hypothetical protein G9A89_001143 [Geosiphon pyriformis]|nr:hypothetical protein G9A89_001143 [Geosiphon pyriformis]